MGVVNEPVLLTNELGLADNDAASVSGDEIDVVDATHYITSPFGLGALTICTTNLSQWGALALFEGAP